ncbi:hypothetical protein C8J57DRAFT_1271681 [Mycena rebaudengoi]|nr:hypothetical protein C8J57DRAFT_1271681 [Mycena rebaudengoi]
MPRQIFQKILPSDPRPGILLLLHLNHQLKWPLPRRGSILQETRWRTSETQRQMPPSVLTRSRHLHLGSQLKLPVPRIRSSPTSLLSWTLYSRSAKFFERFLSSSLSALFSLKPSRCTRKSTIIVKNGTHFWRKLLHLTTAFRTRSLAAENWKKCERCSLSTMARPVK